jgi:hypothetical protein
VLQSPKANQEANKDPLNQAALLWLQRAKVPQSDSDPPHLLCLAWWGLETAKVEVPGLDPGVQAAYLELGVGQMLAWDPNNWLQWLLSNANAGDDPEEQKQSLLSWLNRAESPEEAAQRVLETIVDRLKSENPTYRQAASEA